MITQEEAIALAQEAGALMIKDGHSMAPTFTVSLTYEKLTALCNKVRKKTLLEAADELQKCRIEFLRRMAGEE